MDHSVIFSGQIRGDISRDQVRSNFAKLFRLSDEAKLDQLFSGRPVVLKKGLSAEEAQKYEQVLLRAGALCEVRRAAPAVVAAPRPALALADGDEAEAPAKPKLNFGPLADDVDDEPVAPRQPQPPVRPLPIPPVAAPAQSASMAALEEKKPAAPASAASRFSALDHLTLAPIEDRHAAEPEAEALAAPTVSSLGTSGLRLPPKPAVITPAAQEPARPRPVARANQEELEPWNPSYMPDCARGLCWGGFFMPWAWGSFNGFKMAAAPLLAFRYGRRFVPWWVGLILSWGFSFLVLFKGREFAWENKTWLNAAHFNRVQRYWTFGGLALALLFWGVITYFIMQGIKQEHAIEAAARADEMQTQSAMAADPDVQAAEAAKSREAYLNGIADPVEREKARQELEAADTKKADAQEREQYLNSISDPIERDKAREQMEAEDAQRSSSAIPSGAGSN